MYILVFMSYLDPKVCRFSFSSNTTAHPTEQFLVEMHFVDIAARVYFTSMLVFR